MLDIVTVLNEHAPNGFQPEHPPERLGEVRRSALDLTRAREELGWQA